MIDPAPFLLRLASMRFRFGGGQGLDCGLALADYVMWARRLNQDPAVHLRGTYATAEECTAVLKAGGGLLRIVARLARDTRLDRAEKSDPPVGAIAVVRYRPLGSEPSHFGGIRTRDGRWAIKCWDGLVVTRDATPAAVWEV